MVLRFDEGSFVVVRMLPFDVRLEVVPARPELGLCVGLRYASDTDIASW